MLLVGLNEIIFHIRDLANYRAHRKYSTFIRFYVALERKVYVF